jgi:hypothetical protein
VAKINYKGANTMKKIFVVIMLMEMGLTIVPQVQAQDMKKLE